MHRVQNYRQQVPDFIEKIDKLLATLIQPGTGRKYLDPQGHRSRSVATESNLQRMNIYGYERYESVARVLGLFEVMRELEGFHSKVRSVIPTSSGAVWQAFKGTKDSNACHTCPTHLQLDGQLPTLKTSNIGLKRHIIIEFANCILMPRSINEIDTVFDEQAAKSSFIEAATVILNEKGASWREGTSIFREGVRDFLGPAHDLLFDPSSKAIAARSPEDQERVDMFFAYYEGIFLTPLNTASVENMLVQVKTEIGKES